MEWPFLRAAMFAGNARHFWGPHIRADDVVRWPYLNAPTAPTDECDQSGIDGDSQEQRALRSIRRYRDRRRDRGSTDRAGHGSTHSRITASALGPLGRC